MPVLLPTLNSSVEQLCFPNFSHGYCSTLNSLIDLTPFSSSFIELNASNCGRVELSSSELSMSKPRLEHALRVQKLGSWHGTTILLGHLISDFWFFRPKLFIGLLGPSAVEVLQLIKAFFCKPNFGDLMLWDATSADSIVNAGFPCSLADSWPKKSGTGTAGCRWWIEWAYRLQIIGPNRDPCSATTNWSSTTHQN